jgi:hypothetical protein
MAYARAVTEGSILTISRPGPGDQLTIGGETFVIQGEPERRDPDRPAWTLDVPRA